MNTKSLIAMFGILILGFTLGFLTAGHFTKKRVKRMRSANIAKGFQEHFFKTIALDEVQKEKISPIVQEYATKFQLAHNAFKKDRSNIIDSLQLTIKADLTKTQLENLEKFIARFKRGPHSKKKGKKGKKKRE